MTKLGIQLYGAMELFREDPDGFLRALAEAGYTDIEPCLAVGTTGAELAKKGAQPVWLPEEFTQFRNLAAEHGLTLTSCHIFGDPEAHMDTLLGLAAENGIKAFVLGCPGKEEELPRFTALCRRVSASLSAQGVELWVHNSYPEILARRENKTLYERVLTACDGALGAQVDVGWVLYGGEDPAALLERIAPCLRSVHYKDIRGDHTQISPREHPIALGRGLLDVVPIREKADRLGITQLVDQDASPGSLLEDLKESARYLLAEKP